MLRLNWGRVGIYAGIAVLIYALSAGIEALSVLKVPAVLLALFLTAADAVEGTGKGLPGRALRVLGVSVAAFTVPVEGWSHPLGAAFLGAGTALLAPEMESHAKLTRGLGLSIALYGLSKLPPVDGYGSVFSYAGLFLLLAYALSEMAEKHPWAEPVERNILGIGALGGLLGLYAAVRSSLAESHPELVFYGEWLVLILGVAIAGSMAYSYVAERDPEEYLLSQWRRHEAETLGRLDPEMATARKAVEDFVVRGRKGPLVAFLSYYGGRLFGDRAEFEELISRIADYEGKRTSPLTPPWIRRRYERAELERRRKLVEEVLDELRKLMGWEHED